jgi:hypothetical protein
MGAYKRPLQTMCMAAGCGGRAKWEVMNGQNAPQGLYCTRHADQRIKALEKAAKEPA